jgi:alpha-methylacyl-CoA racemase
VRVGREGAGIGADFVMHRGKRTVAIDLKSPAGVEAALSLLERADAMFEGFRPGVMERLGLGPDVVLNRNPKLVYGRMTGWGQTGPWSQMAGHDINYIALTGALHAMGRAGQPPAPPLNLVGDYGGGALYLAFGLCAAVICARGSGRGQVVDCAMVDGAASLMTMFYSMKAAGAWIDQRDANLLDGGAHFYDTYECADGKWLALGSIEPQFHAELAKGLGLSDADFPQRLSREAWPDYSRKLAEVIRTRTRTEWMAVFEGTDACVAPVLALGEAPAHPHLAARETFIEAFGVVQPAPAPRFSATPAAVQGPPPREAVTAASVLAVWTS